MTTYKKLRQRQAAPHDDVFTPVKTTVFKGDLDQGLVDKGKSGVDRQRAKAIAKLLEDEQLYRSKLPPDKFGTIPEVRPATKAALRDLGKVLTPAEQMTLTLSGRGSGDLAAFIPEVVRFDETVDKHQALRNLIAATEEDTGPFNMSAMADKLEADAKLAEMRSATGQAKLEARASMRAKVAKHLEDMRNDLSYSFEDLVAAEFALKQLDDPTSCDEHCMSASSTVNDTVMNMLLADQAAVNAKATSLAAEQADLASSIAEMTTPPQGDGTTSTA